MDASTIRAEKNIARMYMQPTQPLQVLVVVIVVVVVVVKYASRTHRHHQSLMIGAQEKESSVAVEGVMNSCASQCK